MRIVIKIDLWHLLAGAFCILAIMAFLVISIKPKYDLNDVLYLTKSLKLTESERQSRYNQMIVRILTTQSFQHDPRKIQAMDKSEKTAYIRLNWKCATMLNFSEYDVPIIHQMERSFNPYVEHEYGETGMGGMKWGTALMCKRLLDFMPDNAKRLLHFELKSKILT